MTDSPGDPQRAGPRRWAGGEPARPRPWEVPALHAPAPVRDGRHRVERESAPAGRPRPPLWWSGTWSRNLPPATLGAAAVGLIVVGALAVFATRRGSEPPPPVAGEAIELGSPDVPSVEPPPTISFSPAPVSLSTRASMPSRAPSPRTARPSRSPSAQPKPSPTPPKPQQTQPRPGELTPLPPYQESSLRSTDGGQQTFVDFVNAWSEPVIVYWLDYGGQRQQYAILQPGQWYRQQTYIGHPWVVTNWRGVALVCFLPAYETLRAVVRWADTERTNGTTPAGGRRGSSGGSAPGGSSRTAQRSRGVQPPRAGGGREVCAARREHKHAAADRYTSSGLCSTHR